MECGGCGHRFARSPDPEAHTDRIYGDGYFAGDPGGYVDYLSEESAQRHSALHYLQVLKRHRIPAGAMLDIGCAAGFHCDEFRKAGWSVSGIEPNGGMARIAAERHGVKIVACELSRWQSADSLDMVTMLQVISHLQDPRRAIGQAVARLARGGHLLVETWDRSSLAARFSGRNWHEYNPPSVLHWFTRKSLAGLLEETGLTVVAGGLPAKSIAIGRGVSMMRHSTNGSALPAAVLWPMKWLPKRLRVPYLLGDAFWILARKS